jgi:hypothetical protein
VQAVLQQAFARWGRPRQLRFDNGWPWASKGELPTDLELWLVGCDVEVLFNPPARPQRNGVVERMQGVAKNWAEPETCATPQELQQRLQEMDSIQRDEYPAVEGEQTRSQAYPGLAHSGRPYSAGWQTKHWDWQRVLEHLAGCPLARRVDRKGQVSVYNRNHYVGQTHRGQTIWVLFDPQARSWLFTDEQGRQLRERPAEEITRQRVLRLDVSHRRPRAGRHNDQT